MKQQSEKDFSNKLIEIFGKDTFTEEELTKEFYTELRIQCNDFFTDKDGVFLLDVFWSDGVKNWLMNNK